MKVFSDILFSVLKSLSDSFKGELFPAVTSLNVIPPTPPGSSTRDLNLMCPESRFLIGGCSVTWEAVTAK